MKQRWLCLYVENEIGVLARIAGFFSGKLYNLDSLTVGVTEKKEVSRMTISLTSDERTFCQIKKQLARMVEVIDVVDYTNTLTHSKEILLLKIIDCSPLDKKRLLHFTEKNQLSVIDFNEKDVIIESIQQEKQNSLTMRRLQKIFDNPIEMVRGGSVAMEELEIN